MKNRLSLALGVVLALSAGTFCQAAGEPLPPPQPAAPPVAAPAEPPATSAPGWVEGLAPSKEQFWLTTDYLFTWVRGERLPVLVTTSPPGTPATSAGVLGQPGTATVIGGDTTNDTVRSGARFEAGYWLLPDHVLGVEAGFTWVGSDISSFAAQSSGTPILARPFVDSTTNFQQSNLMAFPGNSSGSVTVTVNSGNFYEGHIDVTEELLDTGWSRHTVLLGYLFYRYDEGLRVRGNISPTNPNFTPGTELVNQDSFAAENEFHGLDLALRSQFRWQSLSMEVLARLAVGDVGSTVKIAGNQVVTVPGSAPVIQSGGLYALASNIGKHEDDEWTVMPEVRLTLQWQATSRLQLSLGYSLLWLNQVARAPDQIDFAVNPNLLPPAMQAPNPNGDHPTFSISRSDVWLQSITFGARFSY
jgi:hypothetical protein